MKLLTSQKDQLFDLIDRHDFFSPAQFEIKEMGAKGEIKTRLSFRNSEYYVSFLSNEGYYNSYFLNICPGIDSYLEATDKIDWENMLNVVDAWLDNLEREVTSPNKWNRLFKEIEYIGLSTASEEGKFTYQEYEELSKKIEQLNVAITALPLLPDQQNIIIDKLNEITQLAQILNKFDWKSLFIGTIVSIIIQLQVNKENAAALWNLIKKVFHNYFLP